MNDTEILDWLEGNKAVIGDNCIIYGSPISIDWRKLSGQWVRISGNSLRDCVLKAMGQEYEREQIEDARPGPVKD